MKIFIIVLYLICLCTARNEFWIEAQFDTEYCDSVPNIIKNGNYTTQYTKITNNGPISTTINNGLYVANKYSCNITIGGKGSGFNYYSSAFQFDIAWIHFFDSYINGGDVVKDCQASWQFTQFPDSYNTYRTF